MRRNYTTLSRTWIWRFISSANALERSLADLWQRSPQREDFRESIMDMARSWIWEVNNLAQNRVPDPVDYLEMRRKTFGADFVFNLLRFKHEHTLPRAIFTTRPIMSMTNAAADFQCLANDMLSYQKEVEFEGELNNGVLVIRTFLQCDSKQAMEIASNLQTLRIKQFEHVVATELPTLADEYTLDGAGRAALNDFVEHCRDWMVGVVTWHEQTLRYPHAQRHSRAVRLFNHAALLPRLSAAR